MAEPTPTPDPAATRAPVPAADDPRETAVPAADDHRETAVPTDPTADRHDAAQFAADQYGTDRHDTAVLADDRADRADDRGTATWGAAPVTKPAVRRSPDLVALVAGVVFCLVAVLGLVGTSLPGWVFGGGLVAVVLVVIGVGVLVAELRRSRT